MLPDVDDACWGAASVRSSSTHTACPTYMLSVLFCPGSLQPTCNHSYCAIDMQHHHHTSPTQPKSENIDIILSCGLNLNS